MRLKLHIGCHKCGSTAIQQYFTDARARLLPRAVLYPAAYTHLSAHHLLPWAVGGRNTTVEAPAIIAAWSSEAQSASADTVVVSSEEFEFLDVRGIRTLRQLLSGFETEVYLYIRPADEYLISEYKQHVLQTETAFPGSFDTFYYRLPLNNRFNYLALTNRWADAFGPNAIRVAMFEGGSVPGWDIVDDFITFAQLPERFADITARAVNVSCRNLTALLIARFNKLGIGPVGRAALRRQLDDIVEKGRLDFDLLGSERRNALLDCFSGSNRTLLQKMKVRGRTERLFRREMPVSGLTEGTHAANMIEALVQLSGELGSSVLERPSLVADL